MRLPFRHTGFHWKITNKLHIVQEIVQSVEISEETTLAATQNPVQKPAAKFMPVKDKNGHRVSAYAKESEATNGSSL